MRKSIIVALGCVSMIAVAAPASALLFTGSNIDLSTQPFTVGFAGASFTFSYNPQYSYDFDPIYVQTSGTGAVTAFGGFLGIPLEPSTFFTDANAEIGPNTFPGFASFTTATAIPYSLAPGDLGLRVTVGSDNYYGFARIGGSTIESYAFETTPNVSVTAGSVPEPASWAMMVLGFGVLGGAMRRRTNASVRLV